RTGASLVGLTLDDETTGLGGRFLLRFRKRRDGAPLPWTRLSTGTPVLVTAETADSRNSTRGIVSERDEYFITVAVNESPDEPEAPHTWRVDQANDETARERQRVALDRARHARGDRLAKLRAVLMGDAAPRFDTVTEITPV